MMLMPLQDDSETTEEGVWGKTPLRSKRNWKELERVEGPPAAPKTPPPVQEPVGEVPAIQVLYEQFHKAGVRTFLTSALTPES